MKKRLWEYEIHQEYRNIEGKALQKEIRGNRLIVNEVDYCLHLNQ